MKQKRKGTPITIINTQWKPPTQIIEEMMTVPLDRSILLDFVMGYKRGDSKRKRWDQEHLDLYRLQMLLNSRMRGKRFAWLGDDMVAQMVRKSIAEELWKPRVSCNCAASESGSEVKWNGQTQSSH